MADTRQVNTTTLPPNETGAPFRTARHGQPQTSLVVYHLDTTRVMRLIEGQPLIIGRDPSVEISILDSSVSRRHARFEISAGVVSVSDLGSTNGTKINGERVESGTMQLGDEVTLGNVTVSIHALAPLRSTGSGAMSHDQFVAALEDEVARAKTFRRTLAVVTIKPHGPPHVFAAAWKERLRAVDRLSLYGDGSVELLLPEFGASEARTLLGSLTQIHCGVATYPDHGLSAEQLLAASREAMRQASASNPVQLAPQKSTPVAPNELIFASPVMRGIFDTVSQVANAVIPVLLRGETGTGKEVLARAIHDQGPRAAHRFVAINCAAIPATLVESVLFGHEKGSFTGATGSAAGVFEEGHQGTVLLDEVGELSAASQAALLRVLETKQVRRVGASREMKVDVRIIAATHRDLEGMVRAGTFREDLLYRLNTMTLEVPPLRERPEEIGPFAERFVAIANAANGREVRGIDPEAMRVLLRYPWPGNIRELRNAIEHAVVVARGSHIQPNDLPRRTREHVSAVLQDNDEPKEASMVTSLSPTDLREGVQRYETQLILEALRSAKGNRTEAARRLQIPIRTLSNKLRQLGIKKLGFGTAEDATEDD